MRAPFPLLCYHMGVKEGDNMIKVDPLLKSVYDEAIKILDNNKEELLKYNDTSSIKKAMKPIIEVRVNTRRNLDRRGCCKYRYSSEYKETGCVIEISEYMTLLPEKEMLTTMVHELLHAFRDSSGHKGNWLWRANILKERTGLDIQRTRSIEGDWQARKELASRKNNIDDKPKQTRQCSGIVYKVQCTGCHMIISRRRYSKVVKHPDWFRCGRCGSKFERIDNNA